VNIGISQLPFDKTSHLIKDLIIYKNIGFQNLEIIYSKFDNIEQILKFKNSIFSHDIKIISAQSILFNSGIIDFTDSNIVEKIYEVIQKCNITETKILVLGSPSCRKLFDLYKLKKNFQKLDKVLIKYNKILCIEPNCELYGGKYFFTIDEIVNFIIDCKLENVKTMIDTHNVLYQNLDIINTFLTYTNYIHHIHVSENNLTPFIKSDKHILFSKCLIENNYSKWITYETKCYTNIITTAKNFMETYENGK
jgi:sugar phosphate isomerase/epimerase